jgi:hypothetical protein
MRFVIASLAGLGFGLAATTAFAQVEVTIPEAGRVKTTTKVENGILGIANSFTRTRGTAREWPTSLYCHQNRLSSEQKIGVPPCPLLRSQANNVE